MMRARSFPPLDEHLTHRALVLSDDEHARIDACDDPDLLERWLDRSLNAAAAADIFAD